MIFALIGALAIVVQDHAALRAAPRSNATELARLWEGDVLEIRSEQAGYFKVYNYRRERGGYLRQDTVRPLEVSAEKAPELLAVLRFLRDRPGSEALGISYGAAYLKAAPERTLTAEPLAAIGQMAERLADQASGGASHLAEFTPRLEVVEQFGIHMRNLERNGQVRICYDGDMYRRVLGSATAQPEDRAQAALGLTRFDCIDADLGPVARRALDTEHAALLEQIKDDALGPLMRSRLHARRAAVWASVAFDADRRGESAAAATERAQSELLSVRTDDLGEDRRSEYLDTLLRVGAIRWAGSQPAPQPGPLILSALPSEPGQTCVGLKDLRRPQATAVVSRCTFGLVRMGSVQYIPQGPAFALAVQPLECWREMWVFHLRGGTWAIDVVSPGIDTLEQGYVEFAGFVPGKSRLMIAREVKERGRYKRSFEELRLEDLTLVRQASRPDLLHDFGLWQNALWRRDTLSLR